MGSRNVLLECLDPGNGLYLIEVKPEDETLARHELARDLQPPSRGGAQVDKDHCLFKKAELLVELDELEGGPRPVPLLLGDLVVLVQPGL